MQLQSVYDDYTFINSNPQSNIACVHDNIWRDLLEKHIKIINGMFWLRYYSYIVAYLYRFMVEGLIFIRNNIMLFKK